MTAKKLVSIAISSGAFSYIIYLGMLNKRLTSGQGLLACIGVGCVLGIIHALFFPLPESKDGK